MKNSFVALGEYYRANSYGLVRSVCRGIDHESGEAMIGYVNVNDGGCVDEMLLMPEKEFMNIFLN